MTNGNWLSVIGLIFDIIGVLLLFKYGLPSKVNNYKPEEIATPKEVEEYNKYMIKQFGENWNPKPHPIIERKNKQIKERAHLALLLIIIGFIFQLLSQFPPFATQNPTSKNTNYKHKRCCCCNTNRVK